jgi:hypothetical protein
MHKSATKCNETIGKWCKNKHGASKIIDTFVTYQLASASAFSAFFALANADLVEFSAVVLAAAATSQAFLEASSLASRDDM